MFKVILMYSDEYRKDMWWVERIHDLKNKPDYYGPFFHRANAVKFMNNEL